MLCPQAEWEGKRFLSNLKKGGSFQIVLVQEMANTSVSSAHLIVTHDTSIKKATLALYLWHLWVQDMNFFLLKQGSGIDGGIFRSTKLWKALKENREYLPPAKPLLSRDQFYEDDEDLNI